MISILDYLRFFIAVVVLVATIGFAITILIKIIYRYRISKSQCTISRLDDYLSIWDVVHKWGVKPIPSIQPPQLEDETRNILVRLCRLIFDNKLAIYVADCSIVDTRSLDLVIDHNPWRKELKKIIVEASIQFEFLNKHYINRHDLLKCCNENNIPPPEFWVYADKHVIQDNDKNIDEDSSYYDKLTAKQKRRVAVLEYAQILWAENDSLSYAKVYNNNIMKSIVKGSGFTESSFQKVASSYAPLAAKSPGRPKKSNS